MTKRLTPLAMIALTGLAPYAANAATDLYFSEYIEGSSFNKALEIYNDTDSSIDLSSYQIEIYFNGNATPGTSIPLSGNLAAGDVFVVAQNAADPAILAVADIASPANFYNGDDTVLLLNGTTVVDSIGQLGTDPGSAFGTAPVTTQNNTLRRLASVTDGDTNPNDSFDPATEWESFGNDDFSDLGTVQGGGTGGQGNCGDAATLISAVQGSGSSSPLSGTSVEIEGVVVGDFQGSDSLRGFFLQEEDADQDGDPATSEGIFVFESSGVDVNEGDIVRVTGNVTEYFDLTEINNVTSVQVCGNGASVTAASVSLPATDASYLERFEGMAVNFTDTLTVSENYNLGRYGELVLSNGRLINPTNAVAPGSAANAMQAVNDLNRIILDDGQTAQNPETIIHPAPELTAFNTVRGGDTVNGLTGVLNYSFSEYRVQPTGPVNFTPANPRPTEPAISKDEDHIRVMSFNVLNYFNGDGLGGGFPTARGADTYSEFQRQRDKIINAILTADADVIGLMEIENDGYGAESAIADLVNGLNAMAPVGSSFSFVNPGLATLGTDEIAVGMIYRNERVDAIGTAVTTNAGPFADLNRQPLVQSFQVKDNDKKQFTVAVNHFKSKGSCPGDASANDEQNDGQGCWNPKRTEAAEFLADWLATNPTGIEDNDYLVIGDINAYAKEDPISMFLSKGYTDLIDKLGTEADQYSYVFFGQAGRLDHALASSAFEKEVKKITTYHINADEPRVLDYNEEFKTPAQVSSLYDAGPYRASDHDPVIVDIKVGGSYGIAMLMLSLLVAGRRNHVKNSL